MNIFLSYAAEHREVAERIWLKLITAGHAVFYDRQHLQSGFSFDLKILEQVRRCDLFVFLLSAESIERGAYTLTELALVQRQWPNPEGRVLVVDLGNLDGRAVPPYLRANIILAPTGDPATETLFAVQAMTKQPPEPVRKRPLHASIAALLAGRLPGLTATAALLGGAGLLLVLTRLPSLPSADTSPMAGKTPPAVIAQPDHSKPGIVTAINGVAAGQSVSVGGAIMIGRAEDRLSEPTPSAAK